MKTWKNLWLKVMRMRLEFGRRQRSISFETKEREADDEHKRKHKHNQEDGFGTRTTGKQPDSSATKRSWHSKHDLWSNFGGGSSGTLPAVPSVGGSGWQWNKFSHQQLVALFFSTFSGPP
jgi:hypothetical protein